MKFIVLLEDNPSCDPDIRKTHMPAHLSFLEANSEKIEAAGPLSKASGEAAGGLWVVDAGNESDVEGLVHDDPFWPTGLRKSFTILKWSQVFRRRSKADLSAMTASNPVAAVPVRAYCGAS